ncbi:hypothetical protein TNCT_731761 [Trichonephila clavata]|uniref:Uncharacterized protein n=1 Tax=Trichonephila clavata TaxID=2740835 RepID=A0A8X6J4L3_TRICU|nr:hypothetical protein TNCT_731761 [Trichonephila clavata]
MQHQLKSNINLVIVRLELRNPGLHQDSTRMEGNFCCNILLLKNQTLPQLMSSITYTVVQNSTTLEPSVMLSLVLKLQNEVAVSGNAIVVFE